MKTVGIFTYHQYDNYGAVLQAYALQTYLRCHYNCEVEIINFCTDEQIHDNDILQLRNKKDIRTIISTLSRRLPAYFRLRERKKRFSQFREHYLKLSRRFADVNTLINNLPRKDVFITGSDQVFNPNADYPDVYYLGFPINEAIRVAYAPSFGISDLKSSVGKRLESFLKSFDAISCREKDGADYLSCLLGIGVPCVLDPVFLLTRDEWSKLLSHTSLNNQNKHGYIFVYRLNGGTQLMHLASRFSKIVNLPIICVAQDYIHARGCKVDYSAGPLELLSLIKGASYVITDSFHGTALSLVFGIRVVPFIAFPKASSRITTIMDFMGLSQNIIYNVNQFDYSLLRFEDYGCKLEQMILESKLFLKRAIE